VSDKSIEWCDKANTLMDNEQALKEIVEKVSLVYDKYEDKFTHQQGSYRCFLCRRTIAGIGEHGKDCAYIKAKVVKKEIWGE